jgi:hypothetical protein
MAAARRRFPKKRSWRIKKPPVPLPPFSTQFANSTMEQWSLWRLSGTAGIDTVRRRSSWPSAIVSAKVNDYFPFKPVAGAAAVLPSGLLEACKM